MLKRLSRLIRKLPPIDQASMVLLALLLAYAILAGKTSAAILPASAPKPAMIRPVLNSMVCEDTFDSAVSTPTDKRSFVTPKFCGVVFRHPIMVMGGMAEAATPGAWLNPCLQHPARPMRVKTQTADYLIHSGIQTMTTLVTPTQAAPTLASAHEAALIELHCAAHNAAILAKFYTARKNYPAATRKARQHLAALHQLAKLQTSATKGGLHHA